MPSPEEFEQNLVAALTAAREAQGLTYDQVAKRAGIHRTAISLVERGERHPTLLNFLKICAALNLNPVDLLTTTAPPPHFNPAALITPKPYGESRRMPEAAIPSLSLHEKPRALKDDQKK